MRYLLWCLVVVLVVMGVALVFPEAYLQYRTYQTLKANPNLEKKLVKKAISNGLTLDTVINGSDVPDNTNSPVMMYVMDYDEGSEIYELRYIWPDKLKGKSTKAIFSCESSDYKQTSSESGESKSIDKQTFINLVRDNINPDTFVSGWCNNAECREINKDCTVVLGDNK